MDARWFLQGDRFFSSAWYECRCLTGSTRGSFILNVEPGLQGLNVDYLSTRQNIFVLEY